MVAKCFKKILLLLFITGAIQANAQEGKKSELQQWKDFIENARLIARQERHLMDSIVHIKAENALQRKEFVLESDELTLKHGEHGYVNSTTNFIALHDGRATVQISPFQSGGGPTRLSMNVTGNGISAQVTVTLSPSDNRATATIIPNFNSLNVTLDGQLVPFKESSVFKGTTF